MALARVAVVSRGTGGRSSVLLNDEDISQYVQAVDIHVDVLSVPTVVLTLAATAHVTVEGDLWEEDAKVPGKKRRIVRIREKNR